MKMQSHKERLRWNHGSSSSTERKEKKIGEDHSSSMNSSVILSCDEHVPHHLDEHVKGQGPQWPSMHEYLACYSRLLSSPIRAPSLHPMSAPLYYVVKSTPRILYLPARLQLVSALQKVSGKRWAKVALCKRVSVECLGTNLMNVVYWKSLLFLVWWVLSCIT